MVSALEHPGSARARPEAGARLQPAHVRCVVMLRRERRTDGTTNGRTAPEPIAGWRQPAMRNILEHVTAVRVCVPSGARGAAVAYAEAWKRVFDMTMAEWSGNGGNAGYTGSIPVRQPWIAQSVRASDD